MEPLRTARGEAAALRAATDSQRHKSDRNLSSQFDDQQQGKKENIFVKACLCACINPIRWLLEFLGRVVGTRMKRFGASAMAFTKRQARLCLNGAVPYKIELRLTGVNMLVLCSFYYVFIDQARIAFFPPSADHTVAIVSL